MCFEFTKRPLLFLLNIVWIWFDSHDILQDVNGADIMPIL